MRNVWDFREIGLFKMLFSDAAADSMVYDKTSVGFKIDFYAPNETYANLDVVLNWVALPV